MKQILCYFFLLMLAISSGCNTSEAVNDPVPPHDSFTIDSKQVGETRTINVWVPPSYKASQDSLPVMYMADGGIEKEDFPHIANTMAALIADKTIPPMILVGIANTERRRDLTGPTVVEKDKEIAPVVGGSARFRAFINDELFPEINRRYRTSAKKGILGESASGLFVMETFFLQPGMFDYYLAFDPSLWWNDHYLVRHATEYLAKFPADEKILWFAGSAATDVSPHTNELAGILKEAAPATLKWTYADEPGEKHTTIFRATKEKAFKWVFGQH